MKERDEKDSKKNSRDRSIGEKKKIKAKEKKITEKKIPEKRKHEEIESIDKRKETICSLMDNEMYVPMKEKELAAFMQVAKADRDLFRRILDELLSEGKIQVNPKGKYVKGDAKHLEGTFIAHPRGFGFVEIEGQEQDLFIPADRVHGAFHRDTVRVALLRGQNGKRQEAEIVSVVAHEKHQVVGLFQKNKKSFGFVVPDDAKIAKDIFIPVERSKGAVNGHKVVVEITDYGNDKKKPEGKIIEIIGHINDPGVDIMSIVKGYDLPVEFSEKVMKQAERAAEEVSEADMAGRLDLRHMQMVTIDGEDAKDLDDAVSLTREGENYQLGVHIADVTNYVQESSALDREALNRGTSVYLVDRVIPMLPHKLSNGICSLNASADRLALSCLMTVNGKGEVIDHKLAETVICVDRRMSYTTVKEILEEPCILDEQGNKKKGRLSKEAQETLDGMRARREAVRKEHEELLPMFEQMNELAEILRKKRGKRGSIDFDFPETKMILDKEGKPIDIKPYDRNVATRIIEDFMLLANETVAQHFFWQEIPFVYRTHDTPDPEKVEKLSAFVRNFGYYIKSSNGELHPKELQKLLGKIEGTPEEALISRLTLRSMKQAKYTISCSGHFGLACPYYCHFTSPIRRYPDLQIHRIIKEQLRGRLNGSRIEHYQEILSGVATRSSERERLADEAERETEKLKKVEFMVDKIGETYEGVISGITTWGIYVELPNTIEGMVHVSTLPGDYFYYDENSYEMIGQATGKTYKLGEVLTIKVNSVDKISRNIDFILPQED